MCVCAFDGSSLLGKYIIYISDRFHIPKKAVDAGESMYIHAFGAYFGLAVSFVFGLKDKPKEHHLESTTYHSDVFAMIGNYILSIIIKHLFIALLFSNNNLDIYFVC